jgi:hypothetical protein
MTDIISKKTRYEFREYFVGLTLREIEIEFDSADVSIDSDYTPTTTGARRSLVEKYYHSVDWSKWADVRKILTVYENALTRLEGFADGGADWAEGTFHSLKKWIEKDGFRYENSKLISSAKTSPLEEISTATSHFDAPELQRQIKRMTAAVDDDPGLAIGTAKELIETTCKTILTERGVEFSESADVAELVKETRKSLGLVPESISDAAKGADIIRRLLSNLGSVAQGLSELRNLYGTGHGKHGGSSGLSSRHARLAVGAAATLATFFFTTHTERTI